MISDTKKSQCTFSLTHKMISVVVYIRKFILYSYQYCMDYYVIYIIPVSRNILLTKVEWSSYNHTPHFMLCVCMVGGAVAGWWCLTSQWSLQIRRYTSLLIGMLKCWSCHKNFGHQGSGGIRMSSWTNITQGSLTWEAIICHKRRLMLENVKTKLEHKIKTNIVM